MDIEDTLLCTLANKDQDSCIYMIPSGGTTPMSLIHLARALNNSLKVCSFAYGGMENNFPIKREIIDIAVVCVEEILRVQPEGPYRLSGYCLGGTVAYEIVRQLEERGKRVECLIVIETFAPLHEDEERTSEGYALVVNAVKPIFDQAAMRFRSMPANTVKQVKNLMAIHFDAGAHYRTSPIKADIHVIRTESRPASLFHGWKRFSPACHDAVVIPGDSTSILTAQDVKGLAKAFEDAI